MAADGHADTRLVRGVAVVFAVVVLAAVAPGIIAAQPSGVSHALMRSDAVSAAMLHSRHLQVAATHADLVIVSRDLETR